MSDKPNEDEAKEHFRETWEEHEKNWEHTAKEEVFAVESEFMSLSQNEKMIFLDGFSIGLASVASIIERHQLCNLAEFATETKYVLEVARGGIRQEKLTLSILLDLFIKKLEKLNLM